MGNIDVNKEELIRSIIIAFTISYLVFVKDISAWLYLLMIVTSVKYN